MDDRVERALAAAFPDREVEAVEDPGPSWNDANRTVEVTFADDRSPGRVFLKAALDGDGSRGTRERAVTDYVRANGAVPVPEVVAADLEADVPYLATAPIAGRILHRVWHDAADERRRALAAAVGDALARASTRSDSKRPATSSAAVRTGSGSTARRGRTSSVIASSCSGRSRSRTGSTTTSTRSPRRSSATAAC
ncbi:phosphotransferase [Haloparvum sedimenti]|uniref:phosphotransferase n=1 Tax=Haloparvum sedimenti TaxID=1678448 RepID=UPI0031B5952A